MYNRDLVSWKAHKKILESTPIKPRLIVVVIAIGIMNE